MTYRRMRICTECRNPLKGAELTVGLITICFKCSNILSDRKRKSEAEQREPLKSILTQIKKNNPIPFVSKDILSIEHKNLLNGICASAEEDLLTITGIGFIDVCKYEYYDLYYNKPENPIIDFLYDRYTSFRYDLFRLGIDLFLHLDGPYKQLSLTKVKYSKDKITYIPLMLDSDYVISEYNESEVEERRLLQTLKKKYG